MCEKKVDDVIIHKEIDLIQSCISRMAGNSFILKGWAVSLIAIVLALVDKESDSVLISLIIFIPLLSFWYLDAFFLRTERLYRELYGWILIQREKGDKSFLYNLNSHRFNDKVQSIWRIMWSLTLRIFYGILALLTIIVILYRIYK